MGRGGKKIPKRYLKECPICNSRFKGKYRNRIYCSSRCGMKAFLKKYPDYYSQYYLEHFDQWTNYKKEEKARKFMTRKDHLGTKSGDIRSKREEETWEEYLEYFRRKRDLVLGGKIEGE